MAGNWALLLYSPGIIDSSLHPCLHAFELIFVCFCCREVFWLGTSSEESWISQAEPGSTLGAGLHPYAVKDTEIS